MYLTNNEGKSVVAERFIRTLKNKIYKYITSISKNVYIDKLDEVVRKYSNTYHTSIKMKPVDVKDNTYIDFKKESNQKNPKFKVGDHVSISNYKNSFAKGYMPNWSEEVFVISKIKNTVMVNKLLVRFMKKNYKLQINKNLGQEKQLREKMINYM